MIFEIRIFNLTNVLKERFQASIIAYVKPRNGEALNEVKLEKRNGIGAKRLEEEKAKSQKRL